MCQDQFEIGSTAGLVIQGLGRMQDA
jgi:hypothetical protein